MAETYQIEMNLEQLERLLKNRATTLKSLVNLSIISSSAVHNYDFPVRILTTFAAPSPVFFHFF